MEKRTFTIKLVAGVLLLVGTSMTMKAQTKKTFVTIYGEKVPMAPIDLATPTEAANIAITDKAVTPEGFMTKLNSELALKANLTGATFTGIVKAPTPGATPDPNELVNIEYLAAEITRVTGGTTIVDATETAKGIVRLANPAETTAGASRDLAVNPANLATELLKKADVTALAAKADKTYVDTELALKADVSALAAKADIASPTFTGTVKAPTPGATPDPKELVNIEYLAAEITRVTGGTTIVDATETKQGLVEIATEDEVRLGTVTGDEALLVVTPAALKPELDKKATVTALALKADQTTVDTLNTALTLKAPLVSPTFTGTPKAPAPTNAALGSTELANVDFVLSKISTAIGGGTAIGDASETAKGIVELADAGETTAGSINDKAVHPAGLKLELGKKSDLTYVNTALAQKAPLASPNFSGTPTVPAPTNVATNSKEIANVEYVLAKISTAIGGGTAIVDASEAAKGVVELADATEIQQLGNDTKAVHPKGLHIVVDAKLAPKAPLDSPVFTGTPTAPTPNATTAGVLEVANVEYVKTSVTESAATTALKTVQFPAATPGQTSFALGTTPTSLSAIRFYINGTRIVNTALSITGNNVVYDPTKNGNFVLTIHDVVVIDFN